jgi:hypothetical protein
MPQHAKDNILAGHKAVDAGEEYNTQELGYKDREDFEANASGADRQALEGKWH